MIDPARRYHDVIIQSTKKALVLQQLQEEGANGITVVNLFTYPFLKAACEAFTSRQ